MPMVERGGYDLEAGSSYFQACRDSARGMQNIRSLDEDENRSNEGSASHGAARATIDFQDGAFSFSVHFDSQSLSFLQT